MRYRQLGANGPSVSVISFGAAPLGGEFGEPPAVDTAVRAVHCAIDLGINFFDVSPYYGRTLAEIRLGIALKGKRHNVVLATKCGRYDVTAFDFSRSRVLASIDESLTRLRTDYVDLLQAHDIEFGDERQIVEETIPVMREIQKRGKARFVGVSGLPLRLLRRVAEACPVDTILSYCRYNLMVTDLDRLLTPFARERGIGLINASPLHMGILTESGPPGWHMAAPAVLEAGSRVVACCRAHGADVTTVALRFCLDHSYASTTLIGMAAEDHVRRNAAALDYDPPPELMAGIDAIVAPVRDAIWPWGKPEYDDYETYRFPAVRRN